MAKGAANTAATAVATAAGGVGAIKGASALASASGKGGVKGTLAELGKSKLMSTAPVAKYRQAIENMDSIKRYTGRAMLDNMKIGKAAKADLDGK